jgi:macrodomain Ter protein organizer (MatP/YcbG family)
VKDKNIRVDADVWELLVILAKKQGRTIKGLLRVLVEEASK